jgi:DNA-binding NtrC family response regulator
MKKPGRLLVVEDDPLYAAMLVEALEREGFGVSHADTVAEALALSTREVFDVALLDVKLPDASGLDLLVPLGEQQPGCRVVVMTGHASVESAVKAMQQGATDYLAKPFPTEAVLLKVRHLLRVRGLEAELAALRDRGAVSGLEGHNRRFLNALRTARTAATTEASILLLGEEGVGKEQLAELIHRESGRPGRLVKVNCGAVPAHLLDAELFGHEPGAFADAHLPRTGALEQADQGTLFLDEVGAVPLAVQAKLARALRDRTYRRLGGKRDLTVGFRMVAATPRDLEELLQQGGLREDFHQQLGVVVVEVPPLRSRTDDIPLLVESFVRGLSQKFPRAGDKFPL